MCRCCQSCWEDIYWNCIEEKYCYDETIANYNPEDDEKVPQKAVGLSIESSLKYPSPITTQPKTTDDEFRREIQTNGNILAPEILAVFKNSLIFQEQPPKVLRSSFRGSGFHRKRGETDEQKLIKRLEGESFVLLWVLSSGNIRALFSGISLYLTQSVRREIDINCHFFGNYDSVVVRMICELLFLIDNPPISPVASNRGSRGPLVLIFSYMQAYSPSEDED